MPRRFSKDPLAVELPRLLKAQTPPMSLRALATRVGVAQSHLSRVLGAKDARRPSRDLLERIAAALEVEPAHFREYREYVVLDAIVEDVGLLDRAYAVVANRR